MLHPLLWAAWGAVAAILVAHSALYLRLAWARARLPPPRDPPHAQEASRTEPWVTVQVCVRNEGPLVASCLQAVAALDWPRDRLEVQLLDDSGPGQAQANAATVARLAAEGLAITHLRRGSRDGFKAGALQHGLGRARGDWLVPLDADFLLPADFLRRLAPHLQPGVACAQARWSHRNAGANALTRAQDLAMDAHFVVEQAVRAADGTLMSFNSTACAWSRAAVVAAGGWDGSTLAEDLDLATRAHLAGGRFAYLEGTTASALLPTRLGPFGDQQARWARGSLQNARRHTGAVWRARRMGAGRRLGTLHHLWHYSIHPLILLLFGLQAALALAGGTPAAPMAVALALMAVGPLAMYGVACWKLGRGRGLARLRHLPTLAAAGLGLTPRLALAALLGLASRRTGAFVRTAKGPKPWRPDLAAAGVAVAVVAWAMLADLSDPAAPGVLLFGACCAAAALLP